MPKSPRLLPLFLASLALCAACSRAPHGDLRSPSPYLQSVSSTRAVVAHATAPTAFAFEASADAGGPTTRIVEERPLSLHAFAVAGLAPDTLYRYRLLLHEVPVHAGTFHTAPLAGSREVVFGAAGDTGGVDVTKGDFLNTVKALYAKVPRGREQWGVARAMYESAPPLELFIHTGDVVYPSGQAARYREAFFGPFAVLIDHVPVFPCVGNHDVKTAGGQPWVDAFVTPANNPERDERYYSFDWGDLHVAVLDVVGRSFAAGSAQRSWFENDSAASHAAWKVVAFHVPVLGNGRVPDAADKDDLQALFLRAGISLVLTGHDHNYQRFKPVGGITYVITGGGGDDHLYPVRSSERLASGVACHHFVRGRVTSKVFHLEAVDVTGRVFDSTDLPARGS